MGGMDEKDKDVVRSQEGIGSIFEDILQQRLSRRTMLGGATATAAALAAVGAVPASSALAQRAPAPRPPAFKAVAPAPKNEDDVRVAEGYYARTLIRWGEPLTADAPEFDVWNQTPEGQAQQFGYNCDFVGFLPMPFGSTASNRGLLTVNHEYTNPELMFPGYDAKAPTRQQVDIELAAHGVSVVEVTRAPDGSWSYNRSSPYNKRYTGFSIMRPTGPAANHPWLRTSEDPQGTNILGTLNNCSGGKTPWGTILTAEENFHQYFGNAKGLAANDPRTAIHQRYGMPEEASERRWESFHARFDVSKEPNEGFRHGWMVEIDPYDPSFVPAKRTALGRFRHEAATFMIASNGQAVAYTGDDARGEYVYKFVSKGTYNARDRRANFSLLDEGTLYVAKFNANGSGTWVPLIFGQGPLTRENGFTSQGDVLVKTRLAADAVGATKMDRPEDIETNPVNKKVYIVLTNNNQRGVSRGPAVDAANPRANNTSGHIIELTEAGDNYAATSFRWDIFLLAGDPTKDTSVFAAGYPTDKISPVASPDNITFDLAGNMWIATDGQASSIGYNDAVHAVPVEGPMRGALKQFFSAPAGSEICGPEFTPDNKTLFLAIQHPGEGGTFEKPISQWPDRAGMPRPSVIIIQAFDSREIGR